MGKPRTKRKGATVTKNNQQTERNLHIAQHLQRGLQETVFILLFVFACFLYIALFTYETTDPAWSHGTVTAGVMNAGGWLGAWFADIFLFLFGYVAYVFPLMVIAIGWFVFRYHDRNAPPLYIPQVITRSVGFIFILGSGTAMAALHFTRPDTYLPANAGGLVGNLVGQGLIDVVNHTGAALFLLTLFVIGISLFTGLSWVRVIDFVGRSLFRLAQAAHDKQVQRREQRLAAQEEAQKNLPVLLPKRTVPVVNQAGADTADIDTLGVDSLVKQKSKLKITKPPKSNPSAGALRQRQVPLFDTPDGFVLPQFDLLEPAEIRAQDISSSLLEDTARLVEQKLQDFNIVVEVVAILPGPIITRYELQPAPGVKGSQIGNLAKDLARILSVTSVRVVDVIPGKPVLGLEIPNEKREMVRLIEILQSKACEEAKSALTLALGKDISGVPTVADLAKMPHLLVAGTTGSGKSVAVNAMILSLLFNAPPREVRLIMIDPKMLELSIYDGIPHLLTPVVTDMKDAAVALRWCVAEMERRYKLMAALGVRNIGGYNSKVQDAIDNNEPILDPLYKPESGEPQSTLEHLPFIVVVIDELADMMMVVGKKVEELIARLAQKARAAGIHLILATQRPSVDVLTGLIKANIPTRISFQVSSKIDSRTIIDQMGAEQLLGHGDMLYLAPGTGIPVRVHGAFVADKEVHDVVNDLKKRGEPNYNPDILEESMSFEGGFGESSDSDDPEADALYDQAVAIVTKSRKGSISGVQRRLKIGYNRAARMVEAMEAAGIVGPPQSNGQREVLAPSPP